MGLLASMGPHLSFKAINTIALHQLIVNVETRNNQATLVYRAQGYIRYECRDAELLL